MSVLLIGCGLVGTQIARELLAGGSSPVVFDSRPQIDAINRIVDSEKLDINTGDVLDFEALYDFVKKKEIKKIIHTAANLMVTKGARGEPNDEIKVNVMGTANVLEVARRLNLERVVFTSSTTLYFYRKGGSEKGSLSEDNYPRPTTVYASTKLACENFGMNYFDNYGLDFVSLRLAAVFGPWSGVGGGGTLSSMIRQLIEKSIEGEESILSPRPVEFVYSKDASRAAVLALDASKDSLIHRIYNVGMGKVYAPEEIISIVKRRIPKASISIEKSFNERIPNVETGKSPINLERSRRELGYEPAYDMESAIEDYASWFEASREDL